MERHFRIGSMGFGYADWRGVFYPRSVSQSDWLKYYSERFNAVELDTTFHAVPPIERVQKWRDAVPDDFRFAVKAPRAVTHDRPPMDQTGLADMLDFLRVMREMRQKLSWVLVQYPPSLRVDKRAAVLEFLSRVRAESQARIAVEFRHDSWSSEEITAELSRIDVTPVWAEYESRPAPPRVVGQHVYLRLIGVHERYEPLNFERVDPTETLRWWLAQIERSPAVEPWVLLNNDYSGFSIATMNRMRKLVGQQPVPTQPPPTEEPTLFG